MKKSFLFFAFALLGIFLMGGCSKSDSPAGGSYKVKYKVVGSSGVKISTIVYGTDGTGGVKSISELGTQNYESDEYTFSNKGYASMSVQAMGTNSSSTLKAQIYVDGKLAKESSAEGKILVTSVSAAE